MEGEVWLEGLLLGGGRRWMEVEGREVGVW